MCSITSEDFLVKDSFLKLSRYVVFSRKFTRNQQWWTRVHHIFWIQNSLATPVALEVVNVAKLCYQILFSMSVNTKQRYHKTPKHMLICKRNSIVQPRSKSTFVYDFIACGCSHSSSVFHSIEFKLF